MKSVHWDLHCIWSIFTPMFLSKADEVGPPRISTVSGVFSLQCFSVRGMKLLHWICDGHCLARLVVSKKNDVIFPQIMCLQHIRVPQIMCLQHTRVPQMMCLQHIRVPQSVLFSAHQNPTDDAVFPTDAAIFNTSESHKQCCLHHISIPQKMLSSPQTMTSSTHQSPTDDAVFGLFNG